MEKLKQYNEFMYFLNARGKKWWWRGEERHNDTGELKFSQLWALGGGSPSAGGGATSSNHQAPPCFRILPCRCVAHTSGRARCCWWGGCRQWWPEH